jgi:hypothetical protein
VCGRWYRALGSSHSWRTHGVTADEYRDLVGLRPRHALCRSARQPALVVPELLGQGEGAASE